MSHIVHVVESFGAGTLSMLCAMANAQAADGHRITLIHSIREETPANWRSLFDARIATVELRMGRAISPLADWRCGRQLAALLRQLQPDIVHLHSSKAGALGRLVGLFVRGPRYFFSPHGLSFLQRAEGRLKNSVFLAIEKLLARMPVTLVACSPSEGQEIRQHLTQRVVVVENAVDLAAIPAAPGNPGVVRIGTVGRVALARNPELFARIAARVAQPGVEFIWIGGGDASGEAALQAAGVQLTGWVDRSAALNHLATLDIYIQTSRWEGLPVAVIEAMAAGLPVVATDVVGNRDLVRDGQNGYLARSADEFASRLHALIADAAARRQLGAAAHAFAAQHYALGTMMHKLYAAYGIAPALHP
ncbi:O-antigen biosynthesis glycosyltransferase WbnH [Andreprevotia sp. IGB-42]|uniref:glycosyltransferase n=1 Tax=Andreprevotia sp. IGB-42 TaxID=2497473 RepID=UPI001359AC5C|nr:glycosyltransferase [Andreprevotia sp. IGB-42]KAF0814540.1 O-antigen biosynthesis glycosyltransferase WbnH [Andreprevotia sp. IGB-42]